MRVFIRLIAVLISTLSIEHFTYASCSIKAIPAERRMAEADLVFVGKILKSQKAKAPLENFTYVSKIEVTESFKGSTNGTIVNVFWKPFLPHECDPKSTDFPRKIGGQLEKSPMKFLIVAKKDGNDFFTTAELGAGVLIKRDYEELKKIEQSANKK